MFHIFTSPYHDTMVQLALLNLVALISPGPDFAIVIRNSIIYGRRFGFFTILGIQLGEMIHLTYIVLGMHIFVVNNMWILTIVKFVGCLYLIYLGIKMLFTQAENSETDFKKNIKNYSLFQAINTGFLTNLLNPKAIIFFISVFSITVDINTPPNILFVYSLIIISTSIFWFGIVAMVFTHASIRNKMLSIKHWIDRGTGILLILISIKLALTTEY